MPDETVIEEHIAQLVPAFYARVRLDPLLGPIFENAIDNWPRHLEQLKDFWSSVMLGTAQYKGQPLVAHLRHETQLTTEAFARWLTLWRETTADLLASDVAAGFQEKADRIAESLQLGLQLHRERAARESIPLCRYEELARRENDLRTTGGLDLQTPDTKQ